MHKLHGTLKMWSRPGDGHHRGLTEYNNNGQSIRWNNWKNWGNNVEYRINQFSGAIPSVLKNLFMFRISFSANDLDIPVMWLSLSDTMALWLKFPILSKKLGCIQMIDFRLINAHFCINGYPTVVTIKSSLPPERKNQWNSIKIYNNHRDVADHNKL